MSTMASAACATSSAVRVRERETDPSRTPDFSAALSSGWLACAAGRSAVSTPVANATTAVYASMRPSMGLPLQAESRNNFV